MRKLKTQAVAFAGATFACMGLSAWCHASQRFLQIGAFGQVSVQARNATPSSVAILAAEADAKNQASRLLEDAGALVISFDAKSFLARLQKTKSHCAYPAADVEALSQNVQKEWGVGSYKSPVLVGQGVGASLVYAVLAQAPPSTFKGAISIGFCDHIKLEKPLCKGDGLRSEERSGDVWHLFPAETLQGSWTVLQGQNDTVCLPSTMEAYVKRVPGADLVLLPNVGRVNGTEKGWSSPLMDAYKRMAATEDSTPPSTNASTAGLPLIEVPAASDQRDLFAVVISGDGGWAGIDRQIAKALSNDGISVVGLNSLKYFWKKRTPEQTAQDVERIVSRYSKQWGKSRVVLVGYSRGADVMPFVVHRLSPDVQEKVSLIALLGLESSVEFEIHPSDFFNLASKNALPIRPEFDRIKDKKVLCFYGEEESDSLCAQLPASVADVRKMRGGHHFGGDYQSIANMILAETDRTR